MVQPRGLVISEAYFNSINKNPYGGTGSCTASTTLSSSMCLGQTQLLILVISIRIRTNVGTESGGNAYSPASGYD